jgi:asparaginyl-tRNA synthetase
MQETTRMNVAALLKSKETGIHISVKGWVRTKRGNKQLAFIALNDGSIIHNIQIVADLSRFDPEWMKKVHTGACIHVTGVLVPSPGQEQPVEIQAETIEVYGTADPETYPLQKKGHSLEFLREIAHLRFRTNTFGAVMRIRHAMAYAIHTYFNDHGFFYLHSPIITGSDAEGAGAMFRVSTLDPVKPPLTTEGKVDWSQDFFGKETNLTVSASFKLSLAPWPCPKFTPSVPLSGRRTPTLPAILLSSG